MALSSPVCDFVAVFDKEDAHAKASDSGSEGPLTGDLGTNTPWLELCGRAAW